MNISHFSSLSNKHVGLLLAGIIAGCTTTPVQLDKVFNIGPDATASECEWLFDELGNITKVAGVQDSQAFSIKGFPYLRVDRFLASFRDQTLNEEAFSVWLDYMQATGKQGLSIELANLGSATKNKLPDIKIINDCSDRLRQRDYGETNSPTRLAIERLTKVIQVPDEYETWKRFTGLYWLTAWGVKFGTYRLHEDIRETYNTQPVEGNRIKYTPPKMPSLPDADEIATMLDQAYKNNTLGIPELLAVDLDRLYAIFAPNIVVDTKTDNDRIGVPIWQVNNDTPIVDTDTAKVYKHVSYTRFQGRILLQLNYIFWFPARPKESKLDFLGGHLDGLTWRVTLSKNGEPLAFDSIHNCGCYHLFFPTSKTCMKDTEGALQEPAFSYQTIENNINAKMHLNLYLAHTSHYLDRVVVESENNDQVDIAIIKYQWAEYDSLRSIAKEDDTRQSLFQDTGIVKGTQRAERFFLWPMGIPGAGEMRQWGHHATAFFGRRHFDDPDIIERSFRLKNDGMCSVKVGIDEG